jgi:D-alanyl-D-alanine carboxypeptidase (penicillin-binding protein 5/6)
MRWALGLVVLLVIAGLVIQLVRPVPPPSVHLSVPAALRAPGRLALAWPPVAEAALGVEGVGEIAQSSPTEAPQPIASLAKLMTAYLVLKAHPLGLYQSGPTLTMTPQDVAIYRRDKAGQQSVIPVVAGERLSEFQALQALLVPSANNIAHKLAEWVSGSQAAFVRLMNRTARQLGLRGTHYADASGVSPLTQSTAVDVMRLAFLDMQNPVFRAIVASPQVTLPVVGTAYNVNYALGKNGIVGVKTGSTNQAGGCFVVAGYKTVGGRPALIIGSVLGAQGPSILQAALAAGSRLLTEGRQIVTARTWIRRGQPVAVVSAPGSPPTTAVAGAAVSTWAWPGLTAHLRLVARRLSLPVGAGAVVGTLVVRVGQDTVRVPVRITRSLARPSLAWRLTHV